LDALFVLDQSGSVSVDNWKKEKEFAAQLSEGLAKMHANSQFGIIVFGPSPPPVPQSLSNVTSAQISQQIRALPGCQQFFNPADLSARTCTTPTDQAINIARQQFATFGRKSTSRLLFLITDGKPETGILESTGKSLSLANETLKEADAAKRQGISIVTVGISLDDSTQQLLNEIASNPPEYYSYPNVTSFDDLITRLPLILTSSCFYVHSITPDVGCGGDTIAVIGENLFATDVLLRCRFTFPTGDQVIVGGHHFNNTLMHCAVPDRLDSANSAIVEVTTDGQGFTDNGLTFHYVGNCSQRRSDDNITAFGIVSMTQGETADWWPWLFFLLLPLLCCLLLCAWCCRKRKPKEQRAQVVSTTETTLEEEVFQIEGLETNSVPPNSPQKWKVQPAAYIGFGKGKMDVNWNGEAPESAPHALKRQQIPTSTLGNVEEIPLTPSLAHVGEGNRCAKKRACCPWLCCVGNQAEPHYPRNEGEEQQLASSVPRVVFHSDSGRVEGNTTFESKNDVEG
jgi:uncharacterized protein YegL